MLGIPAEDLSEEKSDAEERSEQSTPSSEQESQQESSERDARSTQFGMPATGQGSDDSSPRIDPSASGPEESASDWSDLDPSGLEAGEEDEPGREPHSTQFGVPASEEEPASDTGDETRSSASDAGSPAEDWSDLGEAVEADPDEGGIVSAWGVDGEADAEQGSADEGSGPDTGRRPPDSATEEGSGSESRKTQMGMPRFDPDRVADEENDTADELGDEDTAPGAPHESVETTQPDREVSAGAERGGGSGGAVDEKDERTQRVDLDALRRQSRAEEPEEREGSSEAGDSDETGQRGRDTSPGSRVVRQSTGSGDESGEEDTPEPKSTLHGRAGKALGSGFREPERPDRSSEVVEGEARKVEATGEDSASGGAAGDESSERDPGETMGGMPGEELFGVEEEEGGAETEGDDREAARRTQLGQPVVGSSSEESAGSGREPDSGTDRNRAERSSDGSAHRDEPAATGEAVGFEVDSSGGGEEMQSPGEFAAEMPARTGEGEAGDSPVDSDRYVARDEAAEGPSREESRSKGDGRPPSQSPTANSPDAGPHEDLEQGTEPESVDGGEAGEGAMDLELDAESSPDHLFEEIEEGVASDLEERELEEVDFGGSDGERGEDFGFESLSEGDPEEPSEPEEPETGAATGGLEELQDDSGEATRQIDRPEQFADGLELEGPDEETVLEGESDETPSRTLEAVDGPGEQDAEEASEGEEGTETGARPDEVPSEPTSPPVALEGGGDAAQSVVGVLAGLTLASFLAVQTATSGIVGHYLVVSLTLASGLGAGVSLVVPFVAARSQTKSLIYLGFGMLVASLAVAVVLVVTQQLTLGPVLALSGAMLAVGAGLAPAMQ